MDWSAIGAAIAVFAKTETFKLLASTAFGSFFGALGAQVLASRGQKRQAVVAELNSVRAALMLCYSIANRFVSLKKQITRPLRNVYVQSRQDYDSFFDKSKNYRGPPPLVFEFSADLQTISPVKVPIETLERYVFERVSITGRALAAAVELVGAVDGLEKAIAFRNGLISEFKKAELPEQEFRERYFGLKSASGATDQQFSSNVHVLFAQTDDCIFFANVLARDLFTYGQKLRRRYVWQFQLGVPRFQPVNWVHAEREGLMPPDEQYALWLRGFRKPPTLRGRLEAFGARCFGTARGAE